MCIAEPSTQTSEVLEGIMHEHDALRDKLRKVHSVLSEREPAPNEIETVLREFLTVLLIHFEHEENEGLFAEIVSKTPQFAGRARAMCEEHRQLLHAAEELCHFATAGAPSLPWWRELNSRCHAFTTRMLQHEHEENQFSRESRLAAAGRCV